MKENPYTNMDKGAYRIAYLVAGYIRGTITEKEHDELNDWVNASDHNMQLFEELTDENNLEANLEWMDKVKSEQSYNELQESGAFGKPKRIFKINKVWIAAASVILIVGAFWVYRFSINTSKHNSLIVSDTTNLKPGGNRATLTIDYGATIDLATAKNGIIEQGEGSHVSKPVDGELVYETYASTNGNSKIHTLSTPVGGQFHVTLSDGTKVWLNAATTIKYPSRFSSGERNVELTGEAYFEVAKNDKEPFHVFLTDSASVTVLGTHFNILSYANENSKEISLLEGSVSITNRNKHDMLVPGMQARITGNGLTKETNIDTEEITGWKDGLFVFHDASIESIMRQVERWYDAKVVYQTEIKQLFNASISRSEPLSKLLHLLQLNGYVHFKIENKTVYVLP